MDRRLFFSHPVNTYNTKLEKELLRKIAEAFPMWEIVNPNEPQHQEGYERHKNASGNGMNYFTEEVLPSCHGNIALLFRDGMWPAGVYKEAKYFTDHLLPCYVISPEGFVRFGPILEVVKPLSVEETRARIRTPDGKIIPYD